MVDITPLVKVGQNIFQSYSDKGFKVSGQSYDHSLFVMADQVVEWGAQGFDDLSLDSFAPLLDMKDDLDVVLLGAGRTMRFLPRDLMLGLKEQGLHVEVMDNGAACRTYNVLLADGRRVCAALLLG